MLNPALAVSAYVLAATGQAGRADGCSPSSSPPTADLGSHSESLTDGVLAAEILGRRDEARRWLRKRRDSPWFAVAHALAASA